MKAGIKIRIVQAPMIGKEHGVFVGAEFVTIKPPRGKLDGCWILGRCGEKVLLWGYEFEEVRT